MFSLCQKCHSKPAVTRCVRGQLCTKCGQQCHSDLCHPTSVLMHYGDQSSRTMNTLMSANIGPKYPKRTTKSRELITKSHSMKTMAKVENKSTKKSQTSNKISKKSIQVQTDDQALKRLERLLEERDREVRKLKQKLGKVQKERKEDLKLYKQKISMLRMK